MNCDNYLGLLNNTYIVKELLGDGGYSTVYLVQNTTTNEKYAAKIINRYRQNEFKINNILSKTKSPYITKFINFSQGDLTLGKNQDFKAYFLFELATKGELTDYIKCCKKRFSEIISKIIFNEILKGMQVIHKEGICHKDIKSQNILLNGDEFIVKICDFGLSSSNENIQNDYCGTKEYMAPEIIMEKEYDGIKADIFSLGVLLLNIMTNKFLFDDARVTNNNTPQTLYDYIRLKNNQIWKIAETNGIIGLSEEFKNLFLKMVAFDPKERPSIEEILNDEWMKEIQNLPDNELKRLKIEEFKEREKLILLSKKKKNDIIS